jgi:hypothetical protein
MKTLNFFTPFQRCFLSLFIVFVASLHAQTPSPNAANAEMKPGLIVLTGFEGDVKIVSAATPDGKRPARGDKIQKGDSIVTGPNSSASLAFSNGSVLEVAKESKFIIEEYLQKEWEFNEEAFKKLEKEPSNSQSKLQLDYGDVTCKVKKLNKGSEMDVKTPLGSAGIRGTTFRVSITRGSDGKPAGSRVSVVEGKVDVKAEGSSQATSVTSGQTTQVAVTPSEGGKPPVISAPVVAEMTTEQRTQIIQVINQVVQQQAVFLQAAVAVAAEKAAAQAEVKSEEKKKSEEQAGDKPNEQGDKPSDQGDKPSDKPKDQGDKPKAGGDKGGVVPPPALPPRPVLPPPPKPTPTPTKSKI